MNTVAIIGVGVMGETILGGLVRAGWPPDELIAVDQVASRLEEIGSHYGVRTADLATAAAQADTVVVVVKPQDADGAFRLIGEAMRPGTLVVSICAGLTTAHIEGLLPDGALVVRVMPNTPAQVAEGMSAVSAGSHASQAELDRVIQMMSAVGKAVVVDEKYQDAVTAISGSGPAYVFLVAEAMIDAGVLLGVARPVATQLVAQTLYGSAKLLAESGTHPTVLRERVTSPGGTTAAALRELEDHGLRAAFTDAMEAAYARSRELAG